ncbi:MAG TPA: MFS transporter, partial [Acidimicrobiales bacterium]
FRLTESATNLAITMAANFVPYLLFGLVLGAVVDRVDRRRMMILVELARGGVIAVLPVLYLTGDLQVGHVYAVAFVQSTLGILFDAGEFAAIPNLVGTDDLVTANGRIMATNQAGQVLGPVLAGALVAVMAPADLLLIDAAEAVEEREGGAVARLVADVREGLAFVWGHPVLRSISLMMALINFVAATAQTQLVLFGKTVLDLSDARVGWLFAAGSAGVVVIGLVAGAFRRRLSFPVVALGALVVSGLALSAMAYARWYPLVLVLWAAYTGFGLLLNINTGALRQAIVPNQMLGRVMSIAGVLAWSAIPLGALAGAWVIDATEDVAAVYAGIGLLTAAIAAAFALSPIRHGERYLAEAKAAREAVAAADHPLAPEESAALVATLRPEPSP